MVVNTINVLDRMGETWISGVTTANMLRRLLHTGDQRRKAPMGPKAAAMPRGVKRTANPVAEGTGDGQPARKDESSGRLNSQSQAYE